jgi:predicted peptidase
MGLAPDDRAVTLQPERSGGPFGGPTMWRIMFVLALSLTALSLASGRVRAQPRETGFLDRTVRVDGREHRFQVYVPRGYRPRARTPVILALHGGGERGVDGLIQTEVGLGGALRRYADRYPAIVVFPQAEPGTVWQDRSAEVALAALDQAMREFRGDRDRVYLVGLSMGGNGSWYLAYRHPERFAAIAVVCGFVQPRGGYGAVAPGEDPYAAVAKRIARIPVWIAHGDADAVVPVEESRRMNAALKAVGADVRYVELAGVGHGAWDATFRDEAFPAWLFAQHRR